MDASDLERIAMEEILREAKNAAERAKEMGASGWLKPVIPRTNKRFMHNTLVSTMRDLRRPGRYRKSWSRSSSRSHSRSRSPVISRHISKKSRRGDRYDRHSSKSKGREKATSKPDVPPIDITVNPGHPISGKEGEVATVQTQPPGDNGVLDNGKTNTNGSTAEEEHSKHGKHKKKKSKHKKKKKKKSHKKHKSHKEEKSEKV